MDKYLYLYTLIKDDYINFNPSIEGYSYEDVFKINNKKLYIKLGLPGKTAEYIVNRVLEINIDKEWDDFLKSGVRTTVYGDDDYPERLINIEDAPEVLFYYGNLPSDDVRSVAIIGSRKCSEYGRFMTEKIAEGLSREGINIISGMALGIDGIR